LGEDKRADGVIWHDGIVKGGKRTADGVIWHDGIAKGGKRTADGVIWHDGIVKSADKASQGVVWHSVTDVNHAQTAANDSGISRTSPQMTLIRKWAVKNTVNASTEPNNIIKLELSEN
jgi:hypothetical protein